MRLRRVLDHTTRLDVAALVSEIVPSTLYRKRKKHGL
jgi:hypothetical protein